MYSVIGKGIGKMEYKETVNKTKKQRYDVVLLFLCYISL